MRPPPATGGTGSTPPPPRELVLVANRLPVQRVRREGKAIWKTSDGGLVSALGPVIRERGGLWIGWSGTHRGDDAPLTRVDDIALRPVPLSKDEVVGYYQGFSNATLWPLYHDLLREPRLSAETWRTYREVNARFAAEAAAAAPPNATVWVQDYHLQLVPRMLRRRRPDLRIGFFLHIPMPPRQIFARLPWRREIVDGLLGADVIGFQTEADAVNARAIVKCYSHAVPVGTDFVVGGRRVCLGAFPISIDVDRIEATTRSPAVRAKITRLRENLGQGRKILLGVDRLDYTKGIEERLAAFERCLDDGRLDPAEHVLVQVAVPSREQVEDYAALRGRVEELVGHINGCYGEPGREVVCYRYRSLPFEDLVAYYGAADVMLVTPLRDGMNLVAKEFVAARTDGGGVLLLSEFAGAAAELESAVLANPHDAEGLADALERCLAMPEEEARERMTALRRHVRRHDVRHWASDFLGALDRAGHRVTRRRAFSHLSALPTAAV